MDIIIPRDDRVYARNLIGRARHLMFLARQRELAPFNISSRQAYVLFLLRNIDHKATLAELAKYTDRSIGTISIQITRMAKDGLVKKTRENRKSAQLKFEITAKGLDIYNAVNEMRSEKEIMSVLSKEERQQLISILNKLINKAEKYR